MPSELLPHFYSPASDALSCDILVAGGGIVGLWIARLSSRQGASVILLDAGRPGQGASGGLLGALMPHMPERWNVKKQFQFEALVSLEQRIGELQDETGVDCGYRRCGRLLPLAVERQAELAGVRAAEADRRWAGEAADHFSWRLVESGPEEDWPALNTMPFGLVHETLAARVNPRRYLAALQASLADTVPVIGGDGLRSPIRNGSAETEAGRQIRCGCVVLAAGHACFDLLGRWTGSAPSDYGTPVKGQAALLRADVDPNLPLVYRDGIYVVPHEGGFAAVGSTTEKRFGAGSQTDALLDGVVAGAAALCPALAGAAVIERWAGLRPKALRPDPMIGAVPGLRDVFVATGGYKITFGIAHEMARCVLDLAVHGRDDGLPDTFRPEHHLRRRRD